MSRRKSGCGQKSVDVMLIVEREASVEGMRGLR